jgi:hypothetical protein
LAQFKAKVDAGPSQVYSAAKVPPSAATGLVNLKAPLVAVETGGTATGVVATGVVATGVDTTGVTAVTGTTGVTGVGGATGVTGVDGVVLVAAVGGVTAVGTGGAGGAATVGVGVGVVEGAAEGVAVTGTVGVTATGALVLGGGGASLDPPPQADNKLRQVMAAAAGKNKCVMGRSRSRGCGRVVPRAWAKSEVVEKTLKRPELAIHVYLINPDDS